MHSFTLYTKQNTIFLESIVFCLYFPPLSVVVPYHTIDIDTHRCISGTKLCIFTDINLNNSRVTKKGAV